MEAAQGLLALPGADEVTRRAVQASTLADQILEAASVEPRQPADAGPVRGRVRAEEGRCGPGGRPRDGSARGRRVDQGGGRPASHADCHRRRCRRDRDRRQWRTARKPLARAVPRAGAVTTAAPRLGPAVPRPRQRPALGRTAAAALTQKSAATKGTATKAASKRTPVKKATAKKATAKKATAKKATAKKATAKKATAKKATAKKATAKKATAKKTTAKKATAKKATAKRRPQGEEGHGEEGHGRRRPPRRRPPRRRPRRPKPPHPQGPFQEQRDRAVPSGGADATQRPERRADRRADRTPRHRAKQPRNQRRPVDVALQDLHSASAEDLAARSRSGAGSTDLQGRLSDLGADEQRRPARRRARPPRARRSPGRPAT